MQKRNKRNKITKTTCHFLGADHVSISRWGTLHGGLGRGDHQWPSSFHAHRSLGQEGVVEGPLRVLLDRLKFMNGPGPTDGSLQGDRASNASSLPSGVREIVQ